MNVEMWWLWMGLAALFLLVEIIRKHSPFLWLSFSAAGAGVLSLLGIPAAGQCAVFVNISGILIVLERRFLERYSFKSESELKAEKRAAADEKAALGVEDEPQYVNIFRKTGNSWDIQYRGRHYAVKSSVGLLHIRNLIDRKGEWIHCSTLKQLASGENSNAAARPYSNMTAEQLDGENLRRLEDIQPEDVIAKMPLAKLRNLREELVEKLEADDFPDPEEKIEQRELLEQIEKYLNSVTDHKGRSRKLDDCAETDRKAVSAAINRCRNGFQEHEPLYTHFKSFIQAEGNSFRYLPDRSITWITR